MYCGHRFIDLFVHGWDLAKATGQSTDLDPALVAACLEVARPQAELLAGSGMFGQGGLTTVASADPQGKLLMMLGRTP